MAPSMLAPSGTDPLRSRPRDGPSGLVLDVPRYGPSVTSAGGAKV